MAKIRFKKRVQKNEVTSQSKEKSETVQQSLECATTAGQNTKSAEREKRQSIEQNNSESTSAGVEISFSELSTSPNNPPMFRSHHDAAKEGCPACGAELNAKCVIPAHQYWTICCWRCQKKKLYDVNYHIKGTKNS